MRPTLPLGDTRGHFPRGRAGWSGGSRCSARSWRSWPAPTPSAPAWSPRWRSGWGRSPTRATWKSSPKACCRRTARRRWKRSTPWPRRSTPKTPTPAVTPSRWRSWQRTWATCCSCQERTRTSCAWPRSCTTSARSASSTRSCSKKASSTRTRSSSCACTPSWARASCSRSRPSGKS